MSLAAQASDASHAEASSDCRNCGANWSPLQPRYCPDCGQESELHLPTVREFVHLRRVYGGRLGDTLWRASFISLCYLAALLLGTAAGPSIFS